MQSIISGGYFSIFSAYTRSWIKTLTNRLIKYGLRLKIDVMYCRLIPKNNFQTPLQTHTEANEEFQLLLNTPSSPPSSCKPSPYVKLPERCYKNTSHYCYYC